MFFTCIWYLWAVNPIFLENKTVRFFDNFWFQLVELQMNVTTKTLSTNFDRCINYETWILPGIDASRCIFLYFSFNLLSRLSEVRFEADLVIPAKIRENIIDKIHTDKSKGVANLEGLMLENNEWHIFQALTIDKVRFYKLWMILMQ